MRHGPGGSVFLTMHVMVIIARSWSGSFRTFCASPGCHWAFPAAASTSLLPLDVASLIQIFWKCVWKWHLLPSGPFFASKIIEFWIFPILIPLWSKTCSLWVPLPRSASILIPDSPSSSHCFLWPHCCASPASPLLRSSFCLHLPQVPFTFNFLFFSHFSVNFHHSYFYHFLSTEADSNHNLL